MIYFQLNKKHKNENTLSTACGRNINEKDVSYVLSIGKVIEQYSNDEPYPSKLILGFINNRLIHVVRGENSEKYEIIIITVYEPDKEKWDSKFERRIK